MNCLRRLLLLLAVLCLIPTTQAQNDIAIGEWRDYLAYNKSTTVVMAGKKVYCGTRSGLFSYNTGDNSIERMSPVQGLSEVDINVLGYNEQLNTILVGYASTGIDLISSNGILNSFLT